MRNLFCLLCGLMVLTACNSVYMKPSTLDTDEVFYADRGGYSMRRSIKETMESRGYNVVVGKASSNENVHDGASSIDVDKNIIPRRAPVSRLGAETGKRRLPM